MSWRSEEKPERLMVERDDLTAQVIKLRHMLEESCQVIAKYSTIMDNESIDALERLQAYCNGHPLRTGTDSGDLGTQIEQTLYKKLKQRLPQFKNAFRLYFDEEDFSEIDREYRALSAETSEALKEIYLTQYLVVSKTETVTPKKGETDEFNKSSALMRETSRVKDGLKRAIKQPYDDPDDEEFYQYDQLTSNVKRLGNESPHTLPASASLKNNPTQRSAHDDRDAQRTIDILQDRIADLEKALYAAKSERLGTPKRGEKDKQERNYDNVQWMRTDSEMPHKNENEARLKEELQKYKEDRKRLLQHIEKLKKDLTRRTEFKEPYNAILKILEPATCRLFLLS